MYEYYIPSTDVVLQLYAIEEEIKTRRVRIVSLN